ncbi:LysR family transcriptional regulator [Streptococcus halotolerans]|uniref:LysR family transcriptional regulator n=1 Tax=Streptococcus halotolerans TaxID=1814128 RepID=UPI00078777C2|nr:LysR family transcriptional regulator [Streptococcus halotolerans]
MDIRVLTYFVALVQTKSISNAAAALHITQPTLSRQLKDLEKELGTVLFYRGSREIQLTDDGQYLYNRAIEILNLVDKTQYHLQQQEGISGELTIGAAESQSLDVIAKAVTKLTSKYSSTSIHIRSGNADQVYEDLDQGLLDFGITIGDFDRRKYNHISLTNRDRWGVLMPRQHPLAEKGIVNLQDVLSYPLLVSAQSSVDRRMFAGLGDYRIVGSYNLIYNAALLVKAGAGIALALDGLIDTSSEHSDLTFRYLNHDNHDGIQILWKKQAILSPVAKRFLEILKGDILNEKEMPH